MSDGLISAIFALLLALFGLSMDEAPYNKLPTETRPSLESHKSDLKSDVLRDAMRSFRDDIKGSVEEKHRDLRHRIEAMTGDDADEVGSKPECIRDERSGEGWLSTIIRCHSSSSSSDGAASTSNSIVITSSSSSSSGFNVDSTKQ